MLNIIVINCDDKHIEYEWDSKKKFIADIESENENIPMLDDALAEVNTQDKNLHLWWKNTECNTVNDLYEECKQEIRDEENNEILIDDVYEIKRCGRIFKQVSYWALCCGEKTGRYSTIVPFDSNPEIGTIMKKQELFAKMQQY